MLELPFTTNNVIESLVIIALFVVAGKILTFIAQNYLKKWAEKSKTKMDDILIEKIKPPFSYIIWFIGLKVALRPLNLDFQVVDRIVDTILLAIIVYAVATFADIVVKGVLKKLTAQTESTLDDALLPLISKTVGVVIIIIGLLWALKIWNVDITPLLASLGVAGLAIGLAVKDSLANVFGGVSMILDQTLKVGDKVKLETGELGFIEDMGLRSTKLRTFDNELIIVPNGQLANSRVLNYAQPNLAARVVIDFGVGYDSDVGTVRKTVHDVLMAMDDIDKSDQHPEVLFLSMEDFYLKFSARFWVAHYDDAWDKKLEAMDRIFAALKENKIDIPFPTQTILVNNN